MPRTSRSATYLALFRATETAHKNCVRFFDDPFAASLLPAILRPIVTLARFRVVTPILDWILDRGWHPRSSAVIRTRIIDDFIKTAVNDGAVQLIILGAGLDCRPYRMPELSAMSIFEIDRAATQQMKIRRLGKIRNEIPPNVHFLVADLEKDDFVPNLMSAGFDIRQCSAILAEGLISHLSARSAGRTFRGISNIIKDGSTLIFTYIHVDELGHSSPFHEHRWRWWARLNGEPFKFGFDPEQLKQYLRNYGFELIYDLSTAEISSEHVISAPGRHEPGCQFYHVAVAIKDSTIAV